MAQWASVVQAFKVVVVLLALVVLGVAAIFVTSAAPLVDAVAEAERALGIPLESRRVETNGIRLHVVLAGPADGPPVVLLHGFPEFWSAWQGQIAPLARAGFRVVVPDQRGHNASDKPTGLEAYRMEVLEDDIVGLLDALGYEKSFLAGHDLGAWVSWHLLIFHPERFRKAVIFNSGHPQGPPDGPPDEDEEGKIGWHRSLAQIPYLPELVARFGNWRLPTRVLRNTSRPGTFDDARMRAYRYAWHRDHAIATMASWLRAWRVHPRALPERAVVRVPTRLVWGLEDAFIDLDDPAPALALIEQGELVELPGVGHWLLHEEPEETARLMVEYFSG
jgi:pimeloyl-ACP methyl ester carboxylesterase